MEGDQWTNLAETQQSYQKNRDNFEDVRKSRGGESVSWDEVREWHGHIYTVKRKIDR